MGFAATSTPLLALEPMAFFTFLYAWQFPHSYSINWTYRDDFKNANFVMRPLDDPTGEKTAKGMKIGIYS